MLKLNLNKRPAKIGGSINTRTERHGEDEVPGLDIPVVGMLLNGDELCALTDDADAYNTLYKRDSAMGMVPTVAAIGIIYLDHKFTDATIRLTGSSIEAMTFHGAKVKSITLNRQTGGLTAVNCTIQVNPEEKIDVPGLLNAKVSIGIKSAEVEGNADNEPELPLGHTAQELVSAEKEEDEATLSATGRAIANSARKSTAKKKRTTRDPI